MLIKGNPEVKFEIIRGMTSRDNNLLNISMLCEIAGVSRSGYYGWLKAEPKRQEQERQDQSDFELVIKAYRYRGFDKGARGIHMRLLHQTPIVIMNVKKIRRLMKKYNLICPIRHANPYRRAMIAMRSNNVAPNLLNRQFRAYGPRKVLLTDITYLFYGQVQKCYLSVIMDAYTKQVLAHVVSSSFEVDFVLETVNNLVRDHNVSLTAETLINSDQGCHYTSYRFIQIIKDSELRQSMSRKANCWDNAPQESFFGHMKDNVDVSHSSSFEEVAAVVDDWIDYYNNGRYQWMLARLSPNEFYEYIQTGKYPLNYPAPKTQGTLLGEENTGANE
jgi:putative transposase